MIIKALRDYMRTCPYLDTFNNAIKVNVNFLESDTDTYSIEEVPINPIVKKYVNGDSIRQYAFIFTSREPYGVDVLQNIDNSGFYEKFADWIEDETIKGNLPKLDSGKECIKIEAMSTGYAFQTEVDKARYQIQCRIVYLQKGGNKNG